jgi:hypothetical protein
VDDIAKTVVEPFSNGSSTKSKKEPTSKGRKRESRPARPYDIERIIDTNVEVGDRFRPDFRITPRDKSQPAFTITIKEEKKKKAGDPVTKFVSTDLPGYSSIMPWEAAIKCLACETVIE